MASEFYSGLNFALTGIMTNSTLSTNTYPIYYGLQYVHSGAFYLSVNGGKVYELEGPAFFLTSPESVYSYGSPAGESRNHYYVCFNGERAERYVQSGLFPLAASQPLPYYRIGSPDRFMAEMVKLIFLCNEEGKHDLAVNQLEKILLLLPEQGREKTDSSFYRKNFDKLVLNILARPEAEWDFRKEAEKLNISQKHFLRLFRNAYGMPPMHYVLKQRIYKACLLLAMQNDPIKMIAYECGFNSPFYFSRLFKKYMQVSPEDYRKTHSGSESIQTPEE